MKISDELKDVLNTRCEICNRKPKKKWVKIYKDPGMKVTNYKTKCKCGSVMLTGYNDKDEQPLCVKDAICDVI